MKRALAVLTVGAFATLAVGVAGEPLGGLAIALGALFAVLATAGFAWVSGRPRTWPAYAYVAGQLLVAYVVFGASGAATGAVLMFVVLVSQSVLVLPLPAVAVVVLLVPFAHTGMAWREGVREGVGLLAAALFAAVLTELLLREQRARGDLAEAHGRLRAYAVQAERLAAAQERNRVARDIHDGLGHALTVVQMQIKAARAVLATEPDRADALLAKAQGQAEEALGEVRRSVSALRGPRTSAPLPDALRDLAEETSAAGVPTALEVTGTARPLPAEAEESLFRAAQEGLTNVRKHAGASRAALSLDYSRPAAVRLEVRDDGAGLPDGNGAAEGFGLVGVRERAAQAGGRMTIESAPGGGATLRVEVPG